MARTAVRQHDFVVVSNRLPVDRITDAEGTAHWVRSPGGLVAAVDPVMRERGGAWVGWPGQADVEVAPFVEDGIQLVPVRLSADEVEEYYEGFSNDTLWPLYHDVIAAPRFRREWWDAYRRVNSRFAEAAAAQAAHGAVVWVHDYQLQLVPGMLRELRPDVVIGFFNHIPFPPYGLYSQLPWRTSIIEGLLGADVLGFQRLADTANFTTAVRRLKGYRTHTGDVEVPLVDPTPGVRVHAPVKHTGPFRRVAVDTFPISIDAAAFRRLAADHHVQARARQIRHDLGDPRMIMLGVDRLDYTKGIRHRLRAYGELLAEGELSVGDVVLVQVASPSRDRVQSYQEIRDEVELTVGRINGDHSTLGHVAISYHHQSFGREEMVALYLAADVMLVTALRDGMNLVAKEYVAARHTEDGVLVLSEFAGAADELTRALSVNPHDIDGLKSAMLRAVEMSAKEQRSRMRLLRKRVFDADVSLWSSRFLTALGEAAEARRTSR